MKNEEKAKVGRPKLADKDTKLNSVVLCLMSLVIVLSLVIGGIFSLTNMGTESIKGAVLNWDKKTQFKVTFDKNGGTGTMTDQLVTYGKNTPINPCKFTKSGYIFVGWRVYNPSTEKYIAYDIKNKTGWYSKFQIAVRDYKYFTYKDKQTISGTVKAGQKVTFIAQWKKNINNNQNWNKKTQFKVTFDKNGGTGTMADQLVTYGKNTPINPCEFTKSGYTFAGWKVYNPKTKKYIAYGKSNKTAWYTSSEISSKGYKYFSYKDKQTIKGTVGKGQTVTFIAQWKKSDTDTYTIKFDANGGTGTMTEQNIEWGTNTPIKRCTFTKSGAAFIGWIAFDKDGKLYGNFNDGSSVYKLANKGQTLKLVAQWSEKDYVLTCPLSAKINQEFTCTTSNSDASIVLDVSQKLANDTIASGYTTSSTSSKSVKFKKFKIKKTGFVEIQLIKDGIVHDHKFVEITKDGKSTQTPLLVLDCPREVKVNETFECKINQPGVKVEAEFYTHDLLTRKRISFITTSQKFSLKQKFDNEGTIYINITKSGYNYIEDKYISVVK